MDHLASTLRKGGVKDLVAFFPPNKRQDKILDEHFRRENLAQVADWWTKRQNASLKETIISTIKNMLSNEESHADVCSPDICGWSHELSTLGIDHRRDQEQTAGTATA